MALKELLPTKEEVSDTVDYKYGVARVTVLRDPGVGDSEVNWKHWLTLPKWTPEQAVWLLYKIDPNAVLQPLLPLPSPLQELLQHAKHRGDMSPIQWKQFGVEQELQWSMPRQLREIQEPVIESVNVKLLSERLNKHLSHLEIVSLWIDTKEHRNVTNHYGETIHQAFWDGDAQYDEKLTKAIKDNHDLKDRHLKAINQAVADGDLRAEISVSQSGRIGSWEVIPYSPTMLLGVRGDTGIYQGREVYVQHMINRDDFRAWLEKTHQWPIPDDCLLSQWFEAEIQAEASLDTDNAKQSSFPADWQNDPRLAKLQKQHRAILEVIEVKNFDPMKIPDGEKGTIRQICEADYPLLFDGSTSFDNAWKKGRNLNLFKMANHASFAKRGRQ
jgi:hypothetical protein